MKKFLVLGISFFLILVLKANSLEKKMVNVKDFGAIGDGLMLDTPYIQAALDSGKIVRFPAGVYRTGTLYLRSGGGIHLEPNALILGSRYPEDYNANDFDPRNTFSVKERSSGAHLIIAKDCTDITISGSGTISGNRNGIFDTDIVHTPKGSRPRYVLPRWRPGAMLYFVGCRNVKLNGIRLNDPTYWTAFFHDCEDVTINRVTIQTDRFTNNSDGLDIDCCRRVTISNCNIFSGDDAIAIRGNQRPLKKKAECSDITVSNCILSSAACGVRIGVGNGVVKNCKLTNLKMVNCGLGIGICPSYGKGRCVEIDNVSFENVSIDANQSLVIVPNWGADIDDPAIKKVKNLSFRNIEAVSEKANLIVFPIKSGMFENITIQDSTFTLLPNSTSPKKHWTSEEYGIINQLGDSNKEILVNCKGISAENKPLFINKNR